MSSPFHLDTALAAWRRSLEFNPAFDAEDLDELERHLRDQVAALARRGVPPEDAFAQALWEMGGYGVVETEYRKVYWGKRRRRGEVLRELTWRSAMLKNYLKVALRTLRKHPGYSFINITGLAVGLACSFFILLWVQDELRYDRFLEDGDRIHRVLRNVTIGEEIFTWGATARPVGEMIAADYPAIEAAALTFRSSFVITHGKQSFREEGTFAGAAFFDVFALPFLEGNPTTALQGESAAVITERTARKLFGEDWQAGGGVLGQSLTVDHRKDFTITGVIEDLPAHSSLQADVLLPIQDFYARNDWVDQWGANGFPLFVKLRAGASPSAVSDQIAQVVNENEEGADEVLFLHPYEDLYLHSDFENGRLVGGRIEYVHIFSVVALFLLLIASINFMNLATARSAQRAREIGVRKAMGANRPSLAGQFLGESLLLALIALGFALVLVLVFLPLFNDLTGKPVELGDLRGGFLLGALGLALLVGVLAGSYPALYLSSFDPLVVLRGALKQGPRAAFFRKGLVVFQFCLSVLLIVATVTVTLQIQYIRDKDLGLDRENVIYLAQEGALKTQYEAVRQELLQKPGIAGVTAASTSPLAVQQSTGGASWEGKDPEAEYETSIIHADYDFVETMQMEVVAGRSYSRDFGAEPAGYVINETLAALMERDDVVGTPLTIWGQTGPVIGVVKDFDMNSMYEPIAPLVIRLSPENTGLLYLRTAPGETKAALAGLEAVFERFNPGYPFDYTFLDEAFEATYRSEIVMGRLANIFAGIAIFISCLGLFGLVSFSAEQRTKEIGVRKVLGASVPRLVMLLTGEITRLVLLGILFALPVAYYAMQAWLARFDDHVVLGAGLFVTAGLAAIVIAWLTVSYQAVKAALADPVESLRYE